MSAKPKVALTQIEGDASGDVRDAVAEALDGKELALIGSREVNRAVDKLGDLADLTEKDFKKLATDLDADAIVAGKLDKVGSARTLKFRLFVHKKMAKGFTVSFKDAKSEKFKAMLHDKMLDKIGIATGGGGGGDDEDAKPAKKKADDDDDAAAAKPDKRAKKDKVDKKVAKKAKGDDDEDDKPAKKAKPKADDDDAKPAKVAKADDDARPARKAAAEDDDVKPAKVARADDAAKPADDDARPVKKAAAEDEDAPPRKAKKKVAAADDGEEIEGGVVATAEPQRGANRVAIRLDIGASVQQHSFKFNSAIKGNQGPRNVALSPVPGARIEGEIYPLAFGSPQGALAGLGAGVEYDRTLRLNLVATDPNMMNATFTVPVKQSNYSIGVRYRLAFGRTATSPTLTLGVGYGKRLFSPDLSKVTDNVAVTSVNRDTPSTEYTVIDPGLSFRVPVTRLVAFSLGGTGMIITNAGPIQQPGAYGRAKVYGIDGVAALDIVLGSHVALRFSGEFVQVGFSFLGGPNTLANKLDNDPTSQDIGGLADRALGGAATLAVMY
ncbi:MAG TPA: hypothetical protein VF469_13220 [Kofleriaceae bacterium]